MTTSANTIFLQSTGPLYLLVLAPWILKEPNRRRDAAFLSVMAVGLVLFFIGDQAPQRTAPHPFLGNILAALSGLTWAFTVVGLRWFGRRGEGTIGTVAVGNLLAFIICLPGALSAPRSTSFSDWAIIAYLGVFQIGLAYFLLTRAVRRLPALETSILILLEPALNPVWTWLVHGEEVARLAIAGGVLILLATVAMVVSGRNEEPAEVS